MVMELSLTSIKHMPNDNRIYTRTNPRFFFFPFLLHHQQHHHLLLIFFLYSHYNHKTTMDSIVLPSDFKYVLAALSLLPIVNLYLDSSVMKARSKAKVPLPQLFATPEEAAADPEKQRFNCAQKSALNFSEHVGSAVAASIVVGFHAPKISGALTAAFAIGRIFYHQGYSSGDPKKRSQGYIGSIGYVLLTLTGAFFAVKSIVC